MHLATETPSTKTLIEESGELHIAFEELAVGDSVALKRPAGKRAATLILGTVMRVPGELEAPHPNGGNQYTTMLHIQPHADGAGRIAMHYIVSPNELVDDNPSELSIEQPPVSESFPGITPAGLYINVMPPAGTKAIAEPPVMQSAESTLF